MSSFKPVDEQLEYIKKGAAEIIREPELRERLEQSRTSGKPLRVYAGFDPTAPDLHLGHTVLLRKLKHFQDLGHTVVFLIGDGTALIGDPTGRNATRPPLSREQIDANAVTYKQQVFKILDRKKTEVRYNTEWLHDLGFEGMVRLTAKYTVSQMLEREDFHARFQEEKPISLHELLYPLAQGYDSFMLKCDVQLGGTDQKFNLLVSREIQRAYGMPTAEIVITTPLLEGLDGVQKMSKSYGNYIGITEAALEIYGKVMSISDELMWRYYELLTDISSAEITRQRQQAKSGKVHPMELKKNLARLIVSDFHSTQAANQAGEDWAKQFQKDEVPENIEEVRVDFAEVASKREDQHVSLQEIREPGTPGIGRTGAFINLGKLLHKCGLASSAAEGNRKYKEGAVKVNGEVQTLPIVAVTQFPFEFVLRIGKKQKKVLIIDN